MLKEQIDPQRVPAHVAIIMDGNGRWAKQQGKPRSFGHQQGVSSVKVIAEAAARLGVKYLTLYTFSTENWNRPEEEVTALMTLLFQSLEEEIFMKNDISFQVIGDLNRLPQKVQERLKLCIERTANNKRMCLVLALSYSSKWEMTEAMKQIAREVEQKQLKPEEITEGLIASHLATRFMPDPDLLIRTGGEVRLSNYLLWQCAYSELYFCDTYWPDFGEEEFHRAILEYQQRERRYGKTSEQVINATNE